MKFPRSIEIQVLCDDERDLSDLIVQMRVQAGTKNSRYISFPKTTRDGKASLAEKDFTEQFHDYSRMALMDYNGTIEEASQSVNVTLFDVAQMRQHANDLKRWPLTEYELSLWKTSEERVDYFLSCRNELFFSFPQNEELFEKHVLQYKVGRRPQKVVTAL
jgi:hypothetical protein